MFSVLVIRLRSLRLLRVSGIVMRLRMFLLLITFLKASHSFRNRLLVICKNAYLFATMIMTSVSSPRSEERFSRNAETDIVCRLLLEKKNHFHEGLGCLLPHQTQAPYVLVIDVGHLLIMTMFFVMNESNRCLVPFFFF